MDAIGAAAMLVCGDGSILETNAAARVLLARARAVTLRRVRTSLKATTTGARVTSAGVMRGQPAFLVVLDSEPAEALASRHAARAALAWRLTPKQHEVLRLLLDGAPTVSISALLRITPRAVEMHVSAILAAARVSGRAALVALIMNLE